MFKSLFLSFIICFFLSINLISDNIRTFRDLNAVVKLPADNWVWAEQSLSGILCAATDGKGNMFSFFAAPDKDFKIDNAFIETFEQGFFSEGTYSKVRSGVITFENIPCYELLAKLGEKKLVTIRIFSADSIFYRLDAISDVDTGSKPDEFFSCFKFERQPVIKKELKIEKKEEPLGAFLIGLIIGSVLIIYMLKVVFSKKRE